MMWRVLVLLTAILPIAGFAAPSEHPNTSWSRQARQAPPKIKVLIAHDQERLLLEATDKYKILDPHRKESVSSWRFKGKSQYLQPLRGGLKWGEEFPGVHQLAFYPGSPNTRFIVNGCPYAGVLYIYDIGGTLSAVNEISIEDYLASILTKQNSQPLADETQAALVIAARTNAYNQIKNPRSDFWDVDATKVGYHGLVDTPLPLQNALRKTRFMVLSLNGKLDENIQTFPAQWDALPKGEKQKSKQAKITISEANDLAKKGEHAASLLEKAFPKTSIQLIHFEDK